MPKAALIHIRDFLLDHGVWIERRNGLKPAHSLHSVTQEEDPHDWTQEEITKQSKRSAAFRRKVAQDADFATDIQALDLRQLQSSLLRRSPDPPRQAQDSVPASVPKFHFTPKRFEISIFSAPPLFEMKYFNT